MSYLDRIATCRRWDPAAYRPFTIDGATLGRVGQGVASRLAKSSMTRGMTPGSASAWIQKQATRSRAPKGVTRGAGVVRGGSESAPGAAGAAAGAAAGDWAGMAGKLPYDNDGEDE